MSLSPRRTLHNIYVSPLRLYFKGISRAVLISFLSLLFGIVYFFNVNQTVYYYSWGVIVAITLSIFMGGMSSGKTEKGWFYGVLIGLSYSLLLTFVNFYLFPGLINIVSFIKAFIFLIVIGALGGSIGYRITMTKIKYSFRKRQSIFGRMRSQNYR